MDAQNLFILEVIFGSIAALAFIIAALFEFRDRAQTEEERKITRIYYGSKWRVIERVGILDMSRRIIIWIINLKNKIYMSRGT